MNYRTSSILTLLFLGNLVACSQPTTSVENTNTEVVACLRVGIEDLFANPHDYNETKICTEAMINVEFEGMKIYPPSHQSNPYSDTSMNLYIGMSVSEALDRNFRNRDWVDVEGHFSINLDCFPEDPPIGRTEETFCIPSRMGYLSQTSIEFIKRDPPRGVCEHIDLNTFDLDPDDFTRSVICARGRIAIRDAELYVVAENTTGEFNVTKALEINELFLDPEDWNMLPGDLVSIAGELDGNYVSLFEIVVLERQPINETCLHVEVGQLYESPLSYADQVICTEGFIKHDSTDGIRNFILPNQSYDPFQAARSRLDVDFIFPNEDLIYEGPGERVRVAGLVRARRLCRSDELTFDELSTRFEADAYCPPVNIPLNMSVAEIEYLER